MAMKSLDQNTRPDPPARSLLSFDDPAIRETPPEVYQAVIGQEPPDYRAIGSFIAPGRRIFFVGIGGISMCGLAELAHHEGVLCFGSDAHANNRTAYLKELGMDLIHRHEAASIDRARPDLVVYSRAVFDDNPERLRAAELGIPCIERAVFLGAINRLFPRVINISGTNGKSTCTAMCALALIRAGMDPTVHLGAQLIDFKTTVRLPQKKGRDLLLSEACEFRRGFFHYLGTATVILNLVHDHIDSYRTHQDLIDAFAQYAAIQPEGSLLILPAYDPHMTNMLDRLEEIRPGHRSRLQEIWFGARTDRTPPGQEPDYAYDQLTYDEEGRPCCQVFRHGDFLMDLRLSIPGEFNIQNAMGALTAADLCGAGTQAVREALDAFQGAEGRFTRAGTFKGAQVIVDYAHHPSAVRVTIEAARHLPAKRLWVCFQPLTHSRVRGFMDDFVDALLDSSLDARPILLSEIYDDREKDRSISSRDISDRIKARGGQAEFFPTNEGLEARLRQVVEPGDLVLIMGVDLRQVGDRLTGRGDPMKSPL